MNNLTKQTCNNFNLLKLYKIYPKIDDFNYLQYQFYIYIYLDPFKKLNSPYLIKTPDNKITFELFEDESILDCFTNYLYHLK